MGSGTSLGSTKTLFYLNIFHCNIYLNFFLNPILTAQNGLMTMIPLAKPTPPELELVVSLITCFPNSNREFHKSYRKIYKIHIWDLRI